MRAMRTPALEVSAVSKRYGGRAVVDRVSFTLAPGQVTCLLGPSGCGKSTLLRVMAGLERADDGEVRAGAALVDGAGAFAAPERRRVGLVFQDLALFPHLTALDNVAFGLAHLPAAARRERAMRLLDELRVSHRASAWPHQLSGGEQQRVAIARALAPEPAVLLLDEPFSGLDGGLRAEVRESVLAALRGTDAGVLVVSHDPEEAMLLADRLLLMTGGRIVQDGSPEDCYFHPATHEAARLLGRATVLAGTASGGMVRCAAGCVPAPPGMGPAVSVLLRPESLVPSADGIEAEIEDVRFGGAWHELTLRLGGERVPMRCGALPPDHGSTIRVTLLPERVTLLG
ncbi:ABC transporter ATP-binding protein [Erythrobacteraceae bacterium CFH 75059]|uniref:ABC transporter ATP-binding protein n=1 Tax=Qipengyuania thermophila TaxID=2509361 RepID=UPI00101FE131|nr:ABC transporter ATP-binding protein [Qipengyuania thermophila]TCD06784.1 ABC transporter ATP-binding protein [Erythrobacteraceae bacterium CFH 75059]